MKLKDVLGTLLSLPKESGDTVEQLEEMIRDAEAEKRAAIVGLAEIAEKRLQLLKADDDAALDKNDRQEHLHHRTLEKADFALEQLTPRLIEAQAARRLARWNELRARYRVAFEKFCDSYLLTYAAYREVLAITHDAQHSGFAGEASRHFHDDLPWMIDADALQRLRVNILQRSADPATRLPAKPQVETRPRFTPPPPPISAARWPWTPPSEKQKPLRVRKVDVAGPGECLVEILRSGYEGPSGRQYANGDIAALPLSIAKQAVLSGGCEYHSEAPATISINKTHEIGGAK